MELLFYLVNELKLITWSVQKTGNSKGEFIIFSVVLLVKKCSYNHVGYT